MQTWIRRESPTPSGGVLQGEAWFTDNADCLWRPVEYVWSSGDTTRITVYLEDVEGEENGNDFALDDLVFYECGPHSTSPANVRIAQGGTAVFSVSATAADPLTYQWQRENPPGNWSNLANGFTGTGSMILGAMTATLQVVNASNLDSGNYRVIVSSCSSWVSNPASLIVVRRFSRLWPRLGLPTVVVPAH
jgi:hypothetical protein